MKKWYYKVVELATMSTNWQSEFDALGNAGWELVHIVQGALGPIAVFKKTDIAISATSGQSNQWM